MENLKVNMSAKVKNELGAEYELTIAQKIFPNQGYTCFNAFSEFINSFMKAQGYAFYKDRVLLESITEEEEVLLRDYLWNVLRAKDRKSNDKLSIIYKLIKDFPTIPAEGFKKDKVKNMYTAAEALSNAILDYVGSFE